MKPIYPILAIGLMILSLTLSFLLPIVASYEVLSEEFQNIILIVFSFMYYLVSVVCYYKYYDKYKTRISIIATLLGFVSYLMLEYLPFLFNNSLTMYIPFIVIFSSNLYLSLNKKLPILFRIMTGLVSVEIIFRVLIKVYSITNNTLINLVSILQLSLFVLMIFIWARELRFKNRNEVILDSDF